MKYLRVLLVTWLASTGYCTLGIMLAWPAAALPSLRSSFPLTVAQQSWIGASPSLGGIIGCLVSGVIGKIVSARTGLQVCSLISLLGWLFISMASLFSFFFLFPGILLLGLAAGLSNPLTATFVTEMVPVGNKGIVTSVFMCQLTFGIFLTNILGPLLGWFFNSIVLGCLHAVFSAAVFVLLPQTPFEHARRGKHDKLVEALQKNGNLQDEATILEKVKEEKKSLGYISTVKQLNKRHLLIVLAVFIQSHLCGISIVSAFMVDIFSQSSHLDPIVLLMAASITGFLSASLRTIVADMLGRKTFLVISGLGMGVTTILFAATFWANSHPNETVIGNSTVKMVLTNHVFLVTTLALYIAFFNLGFGPIRYTLQSELFTPKEQKTVGSISQTVWWAFGFLVTKMFHALSLDFGFTAIFLAIGSLCFLGVVFTILCVPETRVKKQEAQTNDSDNAGFQ